MFYTKMLTIADRKKQTAEDLQTILKQEIYYKYASFHVINDFILADQPCVFWSRGHEYHSLKQQIGNFDTVFFDDKSSRIFGI